MAGCAKPTAPVVLYISLLASNISAGLVRSLQEANKPLKFAKDNSDVKLCYEPLGDVDSPRLVCQFDAAFGIRRDFS